MKRLWIAAAAAALALAGAAQAHDIKAGALTLSGMALRATVRGVPTSAAYLSIANAGQTPDRLLSVDCSCAAMAMMHRTTMQNGVSSMAMLDSVEIPAGGKVSFSPDGLHIMLTGLKDPLKAGRTQDLTLKFQKAGAVKAGFQVRDVIAAGH